jgi:hypothetical protein
MNKKTGKYVIRHFSRGVKNKKKKRNEQSSLSLGRCQEQKKGENNEQVF